MPISLMLFLITLIIGGSFMAVNNSVSKSDEKVLSEEIILKPSPINQDTTAQEISTPTPEVKPTPGITISKTSSPSPTAFSQNLNGDFLYPNSKRISGDENNFILESNDDADLITNWYKEKIKSFGMSVNSFVTTKTNGKVLNKLSGDGSRGGIKVEISKSADSETVEIGVDPSTSFRVDSQ